MPLVTSNPMQTDSVSKPTLCMSTQYPTQTRRYAQTDRVFMAVFDQQTVAVSCSSIGCQCNHVPGSCSGTLMRDPPTGVDVVIVTDPNEVSTFKSGKQM